MELNLQLLSARIATLGERVEDTFEVQTADGCPVPEGQPSYEITHALRQRIDRRLNHAN